ncbi:calmodulin-binding transcription activator 1-like [Glandiceps talaboti]
MCSEFGARSMDICVDDQDGARSARVSSMYNDQHQQKQKNKVVISEKVEKFISKLPKAEFFPKERHRWNTNEEIAVYLLSFDKHQEWLTTEKVQRPSSGRMLLVNRKQMKSYRRDGFCWKKRKDGKTTREDHMKLKVNGAECIYGCYVHSAIVPTFHRRSYWLLQNPDIVLLHYLNAPSPDEPKSSALSVYTSVDQEQWSKEELVDQIKPMFSGVQLPINGKESILDNNAMEALVEQILSQNSSKQQTSSACVCQGPSTTQSTVNGLADNMVHTVRQGFISPVNISPKTTAVAGNVNNLTTVHPLNFTNITFPLSQRVTTIPATTVTGQLQSTPTKTVQVLVTPAKPTATNADNQTMTQPNPVLTLTCVPTTTTYTLNSAGNSMPQITRIITNSIAQPTQNVLMSLPGTVKPGIVTHQTATGKGTFVLSPRNGIANIGTQPSPVTSLPVAVTKPNAVIVTSLPNQTTQSTFTQTLVKQEVKSSCSACGSILQHSSSANNAMTPSSNEQFPHPMKTVNSGVNEGHMPMECVMTNSQPPGEPCAIAKTSEEAGLSQLHANGNSVPITLSGPVPMNTSTPTSTPQMDSELHNKSTMLHQTHMGNHTSLIQQSPYNLPLNDSSSSQSPNSSGGLQVIDSSSNQSEQREMNSFEMTNDEIQQTLMANLRGQSEHLSEENSLDGLDILTSSTSAVMDFSSFDAFDVLDGQLADLLPHLGNESAHDSDSMAKDRDTHSNQLVNGTAMVNGTEMERRDSLAQQNQHSDQYMIQDSGIHGDDQQQTTNANLLTQETLRSDELVEVTDFCPEWSYPEGGIKVLVTGPWMSSEAEYCCSFDGFSVPAALIQNGVLRCYCPAHENGIVPLQVVLNGRIISKTVMFEYKSRSMPQRPTSQQEWLSLDENQFKMAILERLEQIEKRMVGQGTADELVQDSMTSNCSQLSFEGRLVQICVRLMQREWSNTPELHNATPIRGMTLLHLAAALGYSQLISQLIQWRANSPSVVLEIECDPLNIDHFSCTPLMWACALGHCDTTLLLYHWSSQALNIPDSNCRLPVQVAKSRGHVSLADQLELLQRKRLQGVSMTAVTKQQLATPTVTVEERTSNSTSPSITIATTASSPLNSPFSTPFDLSPQSLSPRSFSPRGAWSPKSQPSTSPLSTSPLPNRNRSLSCSNLLGKQNPLQNINLSTVSTSIFSQPLSVNMENSTTFKHPGMDNSLHGNSVPDVQLPIPMQIDEDGGCGGGQVSMETEAAPASYRFSSSQIAAEWCRQRSQSMPESSQKEQYLMLAEKIIDALPARIKVENTCQENNKPCLQPGNQQNMNGMESEMHRTICTDLMNSPASTLSPESSCLQSPSSMALDVSDSEDEDGTPTTADLTEFLRGGEGVEQDLSLLTLSDYEQRQLYKAAKTIQNAFRIYRGRQRQKQQELEAAVIIQSYYRRYKQYVSYKKMTQAAVLIQSRFRSYHKHKQYKKSRQAAMLIQNRYRTYREHERYTRTKDSSVLSHLQPLRHSDSKTREQIAARKIQRFLKQNRHRIIWDMKDRLKNIERSCADSRWLPSLTTCVDPTDGLDSPFK